MNCPSCGAPLSLEGDQESLTCDYCKSIYLPDPDDEGVRLLGEAEGASCPICAIPLMHAPFPGGCESACGRYRYPPLSGGIPPLGACLSSRPSSAWRDETDYWLSRSTEPLPPASGSKDGGAALLDTAPLQAGTAA